MKQTISFEVDSNQLPHINDQYLTQLWHIAQANPAPTGDVQASDFAEQVGREIIKRWLAQTPPALWTHQGRHIGFPVFLERLNKVEG